MGISSGGRWKDEINHINALELKAIFIGKQTYPKGKNIIATK